KCAIDRHMILQACRRQTTMSAEAGQDNRWPPYGGGRKVRTPQSRVTANGRPLKAERYKARNRATETSLWDRGGRKPLPASQRVKRGNLHLEQFQIGTRGGGSRSVRVGSLSRGVIHGLEEWLS